MAFSAVVRSATGDAHRRAERTAFVGALLRGTLPRAAYAALVSQHRHLYGVLEDAADRWRGADPVATAFADPALDRRAALERDVLAWGEAPVVPATVAYAERLRAVAFDDPVAFVAHHYVRYLGDLSGGVVVERAVRRTFGVADGLDFHRFDGIADPRSFKDRYRRLLDEAPWDDGERARFVAEAGRAYDHAAAVFDALLS